MRGGGGDGGLGDASQAHRGRMMQTQDRISVRGVCVCVCVCVCSLTRMCCFGSGGSVGATGVRRSVRKRAGRCSRARARGWLLARCARATELQLHTRAIGPRGRRSGEALTRGGGNSSSDSGAARARAETKRHDPERDRNRRGDRGRRHGDLAGARPAPRADQGGPRPDRLPSPIAFRARSPSEPDLVLLRKKEPSRDLPGGRDEGAPRFVTRRDARRRPAAAERTSVSRGGAPRKTATA